MCVLEKSIFLTLYLHFLSYFLFLLFKAHAWMLRHLINTSRIQIKVGVSIIRLAHSIVVNIQKWARPKHTIQNYGASGEYQVTVYKKYLQLVDEFKPIRGMYSSSQETNVNYFQGNKNQGKTVKYCSFLMKNWFASFFANLNVMHGVSLQIFEVMIFKVGNMITLEVIPATPSHSVISSQNFGKKS